MTSLSADWTCSSAGSGIVNDTPMLLPASTAFAVYVSVLGRSIPGLVTSTLWVPVAATSPVY